MDIKIGIRPLVALLFFGFSAQADSEIPSSWKAVVDAGVQTLQSAQLFQAGEVGYIREGSTAIWNYGGSNESTVFEIGSVSKSFTGIMLAEQVIEGKVALTDTVETHLPEFKGTFVGRVTLQQLATHTSGLPRLPCHDPHISYCLNPEDPLNPYANYTWSQLKSYLLQYAPVGYDPSKPLPKYDRKYSNTGFALLGELLAEKDQSTFDEILARRITLPLGMMNTAVNLNQEQLARLIDGYDVTATITPHWDHDVTAPTGGIRSTASDMMKYLAANVDPSVLNSQPATKTLALAITLSHEQGLGWDSRPGAPVTYKNGETGGFASWIIFSNQTRIGYFIIANEADSPDAGTLLNLPFGENYPMSWDSVSVRISSRDSSVPMSVLKVSALEH